MIIRARGLGFRIKSLLKVQGLKLQKLTLHATVTTMFERLFVISINIIIIIIYHLTVFFFAYIQLQLSNRSQYQIPSDSLSSVDGTKEGGLNDRPRLVNLEVL